MKPFGKSSNKNELFSGLTFSLNDINIENSTLNLVPISLDNDTENQYFKEEKSQTNLINIENEENENKHVLINNEAIIIDSTVNKEDYKPVEHCILAVEYYWFYQCGDCETPLWRPFSKIDSGRLEERFAALCSETEGYSECVAVEGGLYDVWVRERRRRAVFWSEGEEGVAVRRVSWLYREADDSGSGIGGSKASHINNQEPYSEFDCELLERKYEEVVKYNLWHQWLSVTGLDNSVGDVVEDNLVFHTPHTISHYRRYRHESVLRARVVYRGVSSLSHLLLQGDTDRIDHVVMVVHGIGSVCDLRGRGLVDCVSDMRRTSNTLTQSHFPHTRGRVEYLPVCWHSSLHSHIDHHLSSVTLPSVPRLRSFTNTTLVDVLCYSSPLFCQSILCSVLNEMNRLRHLFISRCPHYEGTFSIVGHSLGAMIALDILSILQDPPSPLSTSATVLRTPIIDRAAVPPLQFPLTHLFALGAPCSLFLISRGLHHLGHDFQLTSCKSIINIFHPFDPVAYRLEPLITRNPSSSSPSPSLAPPSQLPHHKGRKRLHLELKDNLVKVGHDLKSKLLETLKVTWTSLQQFTASHSRTSVDWTEEEDVLKVLSKMNDSVDHGIGEDNHGSVIMDNEVLDIGQLNGGRRVDFVLQEAPLESFNDYLFALGSHACYWESEDTVLKILSEIYLTLNISSENSLGQTQSSFNNFSPSFFTNDNKSNILSKNRIPLPPPMPLCPQSSSSNQPTTMVTPTTIQSAVNLPPMFPVIQNHNFFQPTNYGDESTDNHTVFGNNEKEPIKTTLEYNKPIEIMSNLPPPIMRYEETVKSSNLPSFSYNNAHLINNFAPPSFNNPQDKTPLQFFQPQCSEQSQSFDIDNYFEDDSSKNNKSLESIFYKKFDSPKRETTPPIAAAIIKYTTPEISQHIAPENNEFYTFSTYNNPTTSALYPPEHDTKKDLQKTVELVGLTNTVFSHGKQTSEYSEDSAVLKDNRKPEEILSYETGISKLLSEENTFQISNLKNLENVLQKNNTFSSSGKLEMYPFDFKVSEQPAEQVDIGDLENSNHVFRPLLKSDEMSQFLPLNKNLVNKESNNSARTSAVYSPEISLLSKESEVAFPYRGDSFENNNISQKSLENFEKIEKSSKKMENYWDKEFEVKDKSCQKTPTMANSFQSPTLSCDSRQREALPSNSDIYRANLEFREGVHSNTRGTTSPQIVVGQQLRNSPKNVLSSTSNMLNSKPLVPQSGKLFSRRKN